MTRNQQDLKHYLRHRLMMGKIGQITHRDNLFFIGLVVFLFNTVFMHLTDYESGFDGIIKIDTTKPIFHQIIVNQDLRTDIWYITIYLSFCFIFLSRKNAFFTLGFSIAFVRLIYNSLILFRIIEYNAGYSDYLGIIIIVLFLIFESAEWKFRLNIF